MKKLPFLLVLGLLIPSLQACGQTGPLYHPDEKAPIHVEKEAT
ncbi:MAG: lipoprotein [Methylococcales bacterium]|nr:lipoprotein [Methylococcales bacterium]